MTSLDIMGLALLKQLDARGIDLSLEICKDIQKAVIAEAAAIGEDMEKRARERADA